MPAKSPIRLTELPATQAIRLLALKRLRRAKRSFPRALNHQPEGLHDFRVAIRRLRTLLQLYEPWLRETVKPKSERRLRRIARASNRLRDREVIDQLITELGLDPSLKYELPDDWGAVLAKFNTRVAREFPRLARKLKRQLSWYPAKVKPKDGEDERLGRIAAAIAAPLTDELVERMTSITDLSQHDEAHAARISAKKLRYTLEPFRHRPSCATAVAALSTMQDDLGRVHDLHMLSSTLGDEHAAARLRVDAELVRQFARAQQLYFASAGGPLRTLLQAAAEELRNA